MKGEVMNCVFFRKLTIVIFIVFFSYENMAFADDIPRINTTVDQGICSIKVDDVVIDNYKCKYFRAPSLLTYSYLYELGREMLVFIDQPMGNACDGGPLHIYSKIDGGKYNLLKTVDFCGGNYPLITSGATKFTIYIPSVAIDGANKTIPDEIWELKKNTIIKK